MDQVYEYAEAAAVAVETKGVERLHAEWLPDGRRTSHAVHNRRNRNRALGMTLCDVQELTV